MKADTEASVDSIINHIISYASHPLMKFNKYVAKVRCWKRFRLQPVIKPLVDSPDIIYAYPFVSMNPVALKATPA